MCSSDLNDNAGWLYDGTSIGDVVEFTGSDRKMEPSEGMGGVALLVGRVESALGIRLVS